MMSETASKAHAVPVEPKRRAVVLALALASIAAPAVRAQNMGDANFDPSAYNLNAQLLAVARKGDAVRAAALLERGAAPNARNRNGETALMMFARKGDLDMVRLLLTRGADVNLGALDKTTPLMAAAYGGHQAVVATLLQAGAELNALDQLRKTAMVYAAGSGRLELSLVPRHDSRYAP